MQSNLLRAPGVSSHHFLAFGNDVDPGSPGASATHLGAADDCQRPPLPECPGGIHNQVFGVSVNLNALPTSGPHYVALDGGGNLAAAKNLYAGGAVVAGAGYSAAGIVPSPNPVPSALPGSLVSFTGTNTNPNTGDFLLGSAASYAKCDYGETSSSTFTCNKQFVVSSSGLISAGLNSSGITWAMGGVQPNSGSVGGSGGFAPEMFPAGSPEPHPQMLSGSCTVTGSAVCTFPNNFGFVDTGYDCSVSAQGATPNTESFEKTSSTEITIYSGSPSTNTFSYICVH